MREGCSWVLTILGETQQQEHHEKKHTDIWVKRCPFFHVVKDPGDMAGRRFN